jgi:hypothetical protein
MRGCLLENGRRLKANETCTFGLMLNTACNLKKKNTRRLGLYSYADLQNENKELLLMKGGPKTEAEESASVCFHPEKLLLSKYNLLQKACNPLKNHKKTVKKGLRQRNLLTLQYCSMNV